MKLARNRKTGFSLVELVIVIVIIGVIAAIAIPRVTQATKGAGESALSSDLAILRNAIEMYASEHQGAYPGKYDNTGTQAAGNAAAFTDQLLKFSSVTGKTSDTRTAECCFGPYLRKGIPPLPVGANKGKDVVKFDTNTPPAADTSATTVGWIYNSSTGDIIANATDANDAGDKTYDKY